VRNGGTLLTGPWFAVQDEWGFARERNAELQSLLPHGDLLPNYEAFPACLTEKQSDPVSMRELGKGRLIQFPTDLGTIFREDPAPKTVDTLWELLGREKGNIPICLEGPDAFAHIGVSTDTDGSLIVAIQQLEPFWDSSAGMNNRPPVAYNCRLRVHLPEVTAADCLIPESFPLEVQDKGSHKEIPLPPYTWGTTIRLRSTLIVHGTPRPGRSGF